MSTYSSVPSYQERVLGPYGIGHDRNSLCDSTCIPVTRPEPEPDFVYVPNSLAREYRQLRTALEELVEAAEGFTEDPAVAEAIGFARGTLALVQPVNESELD